MTLQVECEPAEVGLDAARLGRADALLERYVSDGLLPGTLLAVRRHGRLAHLSTAGMADVEAGRAVAPDTLWRIFSMTKAVTSVAAMMLWEEGAFELTDEVSRWIPSFADVRVWQGGTALKPHTVPATEPVRVWHLLSHTSGLTYGFHRVHPVDEMYRMAGFELAMPAGLDLAASVDAWAGLPLLFQPGSEWAYGVNTDVLGRLVEVVSGQRLDAFFAERILGPLGMTDTSWWVPEGPDRERLAALYVPDPATRRAVRFDALGAGATVEPKAHAGGHGLVSTAGDYLRFLAMLAAGGSYDGPAGAGRLLGPRTVAYMQRNHLPGGADLQSFGRPLYAEVRFDGVGFGLGFAVVQDPAAYRTLTSVGEWSWGGAASTAFWGDPVEDLQVVFMTQLLPSSTWPLRTQLRGLVQQALL